MTVKGCTCGAVPFAMHAPDCPESAGPFRICTCTPPRFHVGPCEPSWRPTHVALVDKAPNPECRILPDDVQ